ncbi:MAG: methyltransferase protein [Ferruginibacter sp.]|nr:methyltransferase protein [Ferruginibacter sp.]
MTPEETIKHTEGWFDSDDQLNQLYPQSIRALGLGHWTPLGIVKKIADFLAADDNSTVLDIGSGVGKFCLPAAFYKPASFFYGVEQREYLVAHAMAANNTLQLKNLSFIHANFTRLDFMAYDHFYFYNSFNENLPGAKKIDDSIEYSDELYKYYNRFLHRLLGQKPAGTKLVTYHSSETVVPADYHVVGTDLNDLLKFWIKI